MPCCPVLLSLYRIVIVSLNEINGDGDVERNLLLLITSALDLPLRTIKCCSIVFGVTLRLVVIDFVVVCRHQQTPPLTSD